MGLAIVLQLYRLRATVAVDDVPLTEPTQTVDGRETAVLDTEASR